MGEETLNLQISSQNIMKGAYFWIQLQSNSHYPKRKNTRELNNSIIAANLIASATARSVSSEPLIHRQKSILETIKIFLIDKLSRSPKLKIRSYVDSQGNSWWYVYDPVTKETGHLRSEAEVQIWLNQHYYRQDTQFFN